MRKFLAILTGTLVTGTLFAGGLVTNTNQSATWVRLPARNASEEIDAVYYNPAGLMKLENGFHFSLSNQTIWQNREIENSYAGPDINGDQVGDFGLNEHVYKGKVFAPLFPSIYAVYKIDKFAFSLGFMLVGGGGGATYKKGLPSFEMGISDLVPSMLSRGAQAYSVDIEFKGSSLFLGYQGTISYKVSDWVSVAAGARYVTAKNTYSGHLQNVQINMFGVTWLPISDYLLGAANDLTTFIGVPSALAPALPTYGTLTLAQAETFTILTTEQRAGIEAGLLEIGLPQATIDAMNLNQVCGTITGATPAIIPQIAQASAAGRLTSNKTADVVQKGHGITPIFSVNLSPTENLNIAIKYEMATKLDLTNTTKQDLLIGFTATGDSITQFPDGEKVRNDMPAMLAIGIDYKLSSKLKMALGGTFYFDKSANYGHKADLDFDSSTPSTPIGNSDIIAHNGYAIDGGLEYNISDKLLVSAGYVYANLGVNSKYQSDLTFANATHSVGAGGAYAINDKIKINLGAGYTYYVKDEKTLVHVASPYSILANESYKKSTFIVGLGVDIRF
jgi:long-subunit fatty acid transport protein